MRKANTNDMFSAARLFKKLGLKKEIFEATKGKDDVEEIGFNVFYDIFEKATTEDIQNEIYKVLSGPFEMNPDKVGDLAFDELIKNCKFCFNLETLINFTKRAVSHMN